MKINGFNKVGNIAWKRTATKIVWENFGIFQCFFCSIENFCLISISWSSSSTTFSFKKLRKINFKLSHFSLFHFSSPFVHDNVSSLSFLMAFSNNLLLPPLACRAVHKLKAIMHFKAQKELYSQVTSKINSDKRRTEGNLVTSMWIISYNERSYSFQLKHSR